MIWYYMMVPASQQALLSLGIDTINAGTFSTVTRSGAGHHHYLGNHRRRRLLPRLSQSAGFDLTHAMAILLLALIATGAGEYSREMLRKPYVIGGWMYSNGVRVPYADRINQQGYLIHSNWVWNGSDTSYSHGEAIFRGECGSCHTMDGYRPMRQLLSGRDRTNIGSFITMLHEYKPDMPYRRFMPPMVGTQQDSK